MAKSIKTNTPVKYEYPKNNPKLGKPIKTTLINEDSWIVFYEFPDGSLVIEGLRRDPLDEGGFLSQRIRFTKEALNEIFDFLADYITYERVK